MATTSTAATPAVEGETHQGLGTRIKNRLLGKKHQHHGEAGTVLVGSSPSASSSEAETPGPGIGEHQAAGAGLAAGAHNGNTTTTTTTTGPTSSGVLGAGNGVGAGNGTVRNLDNSELEQTQAQMDDWKRAQELTFKASQESDIAKHLTLTAQAKGQEILELEKEVEAARLRHEEAERELAEVNMNRINLDPLKKEVGEAARLAEERNALANNRRTELEETAARSRQLYEQAQTRLQEADAKARAAAEAEAAAEAHRRKVAEAEAQHRELAGGLRDLSLTKEDYIQQEAELASKSAAAHDLVAQKQQELLEAQQAANSIMQQHAAAQTALRDAHQRFETHTGQVREAEQLAGQHREGLTPLEEEMANAAQVAAEAKAASEQSVSAAEAERQRALQLKREAEQAKAAANDALALRATKEKQLRFHANKIQELEAHLAELKQKADMAASMHDSKIGDAEAKAAEYQQALDEMEVHKGRARELWEEAKSHGETASLEVKLKEFFQEKVPNAMHKIGHKITSPSSNPTAAQSDHMLQNEP